MVKLLLAICVLGALFGGCLSDTFGRKVNFFLNRKAVAASGNSPPEDLFPPLMERSSPDIDADARREVLGGSYPEIVVGKDTPALEEDEDKLDKKWKFLDTLLDPIKDIILDMLGKGNKTRKVDQELLGGHDAYVKKLVACSKKMVLCAVADIFNVHCFLHCLLSEHPVGYIAVNSVGPAVKALCNSLGTVHDRGVALYDKVSEEVPSISVFMSLFKVVPSVVKRFTRMAAKSIPTILIKYTGFADAQRLKKTMNALETAVKIANEGVTEFDDVINPGCAHADTMDAMKQLVTLFYTSPKSIDITLEGYWALTKVYNLVFIPYLRMMMRAVLGGFGMMTGLECGLIYYAQVGEKVTCSEDELVDWTGGQVTLPDPGKPQVCGSVPIFPPDIYDELYDHLFYMKDARPERRVEKEEKPKAPEPKIEEPKLEAEKLDFRWVDQVLRTAKDDDFFW